MTGLDLSPQQPSFVPPNVRFEIDDATRDWAFPAGTFKCLKILQFSYVRFNRLASFPVMPEFYQKLVNYRGIRELRISSCDFEHLGALMDFVSTFTPQSEMPFALSLDCVTWGNQPVSTEVAPSSTGLCLSSLAVHNHSRPDIIGSWLLSTPSAYALRAVTLKCLMGQELSSVGEFLRSLGYVLEYLQIGLRLDGTPWLIEGKLRLQRSQC